MAKEWTAVDGLLGWFMKDEVRARAFGGHRDAFSQHTTFS